MKKEEYPTPLIDVQHLKKYYPLKGGLLQKNTAYVKAVDDVSFSIEQGKTLSLVGESGCGKTTVGKTVLRLTPATGGKVLFEGTNLFSVKNKLLRTMRPLIQPIFQDPYSSLNPRMTVGEIIGEAVREHNIVSKVTYRDYLLKIMDDCGLQKQHVDRYPHEFSGGQRQRICIARALALKPRFIVADEPVSALDVSIQAQIINLLCDLQKEYNLTYLFISHDLSVVEHISNEIAVMYLGKIVEQGKKEELFNNPLHPYTKALFSAVPIPDPTNKKKRIILSGDMPSALNPPKGCAFHTRCSYCTDICKEIAPDLQKYSNDHVVACHLVKETIQ